MTINSAYLLATQAQKIPENPDSGMVKKNGLYYPDWATDYLLLPASTVSNAGITIDIRGTAGGDQYGTTLAAGQEENGWCLIYYMGTVKFTSSFYLSSPYWEYGHGFAIEFYNNQNGAQCFTFKNKQDALESLLAGVVSKAVYHTEGHGQPWNQLYMVSAIPIHSGFPYYQAIDGAIYSSIAWKSDAGYHYPIAARNLTYYSSRTWDVYGDSLGDGRYLHFRLPKHSL